MRLPNLTFYKMKNFSCGKNKIKFKKFTKIMKAPFKIAYLSLSSYLKRMPELPNIYKIYATKNKPTIQI